MRKSDRPYLVRYHHRENEGAQDALFVLARSPKEAIEAVADRMAGSQSIWAKFDVTPLATGYQLGYHDPRQYEVRFERRVARVYKK